MSLSRSASPNTRSSVFRRAILFVAILLLAGCGNVPKLPYPRTLTFVSPVYLPLVQATPNKLGVAGCGCSSLGCGWCYSWSPWPNVSPGIEAVPMIRDASSVYALRLGGNSDWLMGFNEPDLAGQADLTPDEAAQLWRIVEAKWPDKLLVAPVPSHLHPYWLHGFYAAYVTRYGQAPRLDALAMHCYLPTAQECIALAEQYEGLAQAWGIREGWVTEFAWTSVSADWQAQIAQFTTYLEQSDFWMRYAPFVSYETCDNEFWDCATAGDPSLFDRFGQLTEVGRMYQRVPQ